MAKYYYEIWTGKWKAWVASMDTVKNTTTAQILYFDFTIKEYKQWSEVPIGEVVEVKTSNAGIQIGYKSRTTGLVSFDPETTPFDKLYEKVSLVDTFIADESEYPEKTVYDKDKLLFRGKKAFPSLKINGLNVGGAKIKLASGDLNINNIYYKDNSGVIKNLK